MLLYSVHVTSIQYIVHLSEVKEIHPEFLKLRFLPFFVWALCSSPIQGSRTLAGVLYGCKSHYGLGFRLYKLNLS